MQTAEYQVLIDLLRETWEGSGMTQKAICDKLGRNRNFLIKIESRERRVDVVEVFQICSAIGVDPQKLLAEFGKRISEL